MSPRLYENKAHTELCGLRHIPPESIAAQRRQYNAGDPVGPPPHCSCIKPIPSLVRLKRLLAARARPEDAA